MPLDAVQDGVVASVVGLAAALDVGGAGRDVVRAAADVGRGAAVVHKLDGVGDLVALGHFHARQRVRGLRRVDVHGRRIVLARGMARRVRAELGVDVEGAGHAGVAGLRLVEGLGRQEGVVGRVLGHRDGPRHALRLVRAHLQVLDDPLGVSAVGQPRAGALGRLQALVEHMVGQVLADAHILGGLDAGVHRRQGVGDVGAGLRTAAVFGIGHQAHRHLAALHRAWVGLDGVDHNVGRGSRRGALGGVVFVERGVARLARGTGCHLHGEGQRALGVRAHGDARPRDATRRLVVAAAVVHPDELGLIRHVVYHDDLGRVRAAGVFHLQGVGDFLTFQHRRAGYRRRALGRVDVRRRLVAFRCGVARGVRAGLRVGRDGAGRARVGRGGLVARGVHDERIGRRVGVHLHRPRHALRVLFAHLQARQDPLDIALVFDPLAVVGHALIAGPRGHVVAYAQVGHCRIAGIHRR